MGLNRVKKPKSFCRRWFPCCCQDDDEFGGKLSLHNSLVTTQRKFKSWELLDNEEKKDRIKYLWYQTRRYFWQQVIMFRIAKSSEANIKVQVLYENYDVSPMNE
jgi:hypothetical protein